MNKFHVRRSLCVLLVACGLTAFTVGCNSQWFNTAEAIAKVAAPIAGSIVDIIDPALAPIVQKVEDAFSALVNTLDAYKTQPTATNLQRVEAAFAAIQANEDALVNAAQVKNQDTDVKVKGVIDLIVTSVTEIAALIPPQAPVSAHMKAVAAAAKPHAQGLSALDIERTYNAITAGDARFKLHFHTNVIRRIF